MKVKIEINGCDDSTDFEMEISNKEYDLLKKIEEISGKISTYSCMPKFYVSIVK